MPGEKYLVAASENPMQIAVRNILNPYGYIFLANCSDPVSLMRLIRSYQPDFVVVDTALRHELLKRCIEAVDEGMLCCCILIGEHRDVDAMAIMENSRVISFCPKPLSRELLTNTVEMGLINFRRVVDLSRKLAEMTEINETRKVVEKAKLIVMKRDGLEENEAYEKMRKKSMDTRNTIKSIAEEIILSVGSGGKKDKP